MKAFTFAFMISLSLGSLSYAQEFSQSSADSAAIVDSASASSTSSIEALDFAPPRGGGHGGGVRPPGGGHRPPVVRPPGGGHRPPVVRPPGGGHRPPVVRPPHPPGGGHHGRVHGGRWYPHPGWHGGWHHNPYWYPRWYRVGIVWPIWYWVDYVPFGYYQCIAFNSAMQGFSAIGPSYDQAAYGALYACGGSNYEMAGCYIPAGYCRLR